MKAVVFSKPVCTFCSSAKEMLKANSIEIVREVNIETDEHAYEYVATEWQKLGRSRPTVPFIEIDGMTIGGFDELALFIKARNK